MTPENRARMQSVLRESLRKAYLPGLPGDGPGHATHTAAQAPVQPPGQAGAPAAAHPRATDEPFGHEQVGGGHSAHHGAASRVTVPAQPGSPTDMSTADALVDRFCKELEALAGVAYRADGVDALAEQIAVLLARFETTTIVGWSMEAIGVPGLGEALAARGIEILPQHVPFSDPERAARLDALAAVTVGLTGADAALATSGSIVLASGPGRGRLSSLLTPIHIAILHRDRLLPSLVDLFAMRPELPTQGSNMVIVTGPSRTADIEMTLSRGVHGPREIHVIIVSNV